MKRKTSNLFVMVLLLIVGAMAFTLMPGANITNAEDHIQNLAIASAAVVTNDNMAVDNNAVALNASLGEVNGEVNNKENSNNNFTLVNAVLVEGIQVNYKANANCSLNI